MQRPQFSIITVVYNAKDLLPFTIESVVNQDCTDFEYLIIDGASKDGSVELIKQYAAQFPQIRWVSEKDKGLYDAMNKSIDMAQGSYLWFMNAGDTIADPHTLSRMKTASQSSTADVLYGDTLLLNEERSALGLMSALSTRSLPDHLHWRHYLGGMRVVHQSFVPKRSLAPKYLDGNLCADYNWCIEILKKSKKNIKVEGGPLSHYLAGGISKKRHRESLKDRFMVMQKHFGLIPTLFAHLFIVLRALLHKVMRFGKPTY